MRDRLIELLVEADKKCDDTKQCENCVGYGKGEWCFEPLMADHLLSVGVIVPPCKVEDTVYATHVANLMDVGKGEVIRYAFNIHGDLCVDVEYENGFMWRHLPREFGKFVFFSRGEAEKALERSENGK